MLIYTSLGMRDELTELGAQAEKLKRMVILCLIGGFIQMRNLYFFLEKPFNLNWDLIEITEM